MSGGSLDYAFQKLDYTIENLEERTYLDKPHRLFTRHLKLVSKALKAIEWALSGDSSKDTAIDAIGMVIRIPADNEADEGIWFDSEWYESYKSEDGNNYIIPNYYIARFSGHITELDAEIERLKNELHVLKSSIHSPPKEFLVENHL